MKYVDEYRDRKLISGLAGRLRQFRNRDYTFMEVCGGHTSAIHRFGIRSLVPPNIKLVSGPGCPVCVTSKVYIDKALTYSRMNNIIIASFGDLLRVPGSDSSLETEKAKGSDIRLVFSAMEALEIARINPEKIVIFLAIGFETTAPGTAVVIKEALKNQMENFYILNAHKVMPPVMEALIHDGVNLDGFICPGHVCTIAGSKIVEFIPEKYGLACVVTGFEPLDLLQAILMLCEQIEQKKSCVEIQYSRVVTREGNILAQKHMNDIFDFSDDWWRGFGIIKNSGLKLRKVFSGFDIEESIPVVVPDPFEEPGCICGEVLKGHKNPTECRLFGGLCNPANPVGACMVSNEGVCQTYYKYNRHG